MRPCISTLAALLVGALGTGTPAHPITASETRQMDARLVPQKTTFILGEPIFASYIVRNASRRSVLLSVGGDIFSFSAIRRDGLKAIPPQSDPIFACSIQTWEQEVKAGASYTYERFLPDELPITRPGTYTLTCRTAVYIQAEDGRGMFDRRSAPKSIPTQASAIVTILPPDRARMGAIIARLGRVAVADPDNSERLKPSAANRWQSADNAAQALCAVADTRAVPWLIQMLHRPGTSHLEQALQALGRFDDASAFAAIKRITRISGTDVLDSATREYASEMAAGIRVDAAKVLAKSPYTGALRCLWTLRHYADPNVRRVVMDAAIAHRNARTTAILQEIARHDPYPLRRDEARAELKSRLAN